ncbi:hypothetical protein [Massilia antarctica]|uniref:hypothetical protein n=1 Tax=Massilia antarctica TaxID=2765360 RepID=UPI002271E0A2|nr:hypothetical protein [Massilia sp. H27-R4]MCY0914370.1 hypothetical protein [Massilia sp. H27-R4]
MIIADFASDTALRISERTPAISERILGPQFGNIRFGRPIGLDHRNIDLDGGDVRFQSGDTGFHVPMIAQFIVHVHRVPS